MRDITAVASHFFEEDVGRVELELEPEDVERSAKPWHQLGNDMP